MKIALLGSRGKTGSLIKAAILAAKDLSLGLEIEDASNPSLETLSQMDACIDFSVASATEALLPHLLSLKRKPCFISGTTALSTKCEGYLETLSQSTPVLTSANFSLGILLMQRFLQQEGNALLQHGFKTGLTEIHHTEKKDAPSGTALLLMKALAESIPHQSLRMGQIKGEHRILFEREGELLEIRHTVTDRSVFASGALHAARLLHGKGPGFYEWKDLWNISAHQN